MGRVRLRTASETSKTDVPATQGCNPWQGSITPFTMYALSDVDQKTVGDGYPRQNDGKLKFDDKLSKWSVGLYACKEEPYYLCLTCHLPLSTLLISIYLENNSKYFVIINLSSISWAANWKGKILQWICVMSVILYFGNPEHLAL